MKYYKTAFDETIRAVDDDGMEYWIPTDPLNMDYDRYLKSGETAEEYEPPPPPPEPTPAEKLASAGLTVAELKTLLGIP